MRVPFSKMHGLGNDFVVLDGITQDLQLDPKRIGQLGDRRTGVGFDQLLLVDLPTRPDADFRYVIYNADGSEAQQCGNGARCFARFVLEQKLTTQKELTLETNTGLIRSRLLNNGQVEIDMGEPKFTGPELPAESNGASQFVESDGERFEFMAVSMGNPHAVIRVDDVMQTDVEGIGSRLTNHELFPEGVNVGFCQVLDDSFARLRVFERGVGETRACGTGACAAAVAANLSGELGQRSKVSLPGGKLRIEWLGDGHSVKMTGPAVTVFRGELKL
ncbi:MAG: diaminopimelate epimerase [Pseudomonadota bacterium]